jgi:phosphatidylinositol-3-phosphatase
LRRFLALLSRCRAGLAGGVALVAITACGSSTSASGPLHPPTVTPATTSPSAGSGAVSGSTSAVVPRPAHTVVVVMENHSYGQVIGNPAAPFINQLARGGALFTRSFAVTHPSQPNYLALFSGSTQGVTDDSCPHTFDAPNLAAGLAGAGLSFAGYAEDLPAVGSPACSQGQYARKHVPWANFSNVPGSVSQPFTSWPAGDFAKLPTVSFVIPNLCNDMHDCDVATGDAWLRAHIGAYADWAMSHDSLLILTWDENDDSPGNQITTIMAGQLVKPGRYAEPITHYNVLATIETAYALPRSGQAATAPPITDIWAR